jgi:hypothetical protein
VEINAPISLELTHLGLVSCVFFCAEEQAAKCHNQAEDDELSPEGGAADPIFDLGILKREHV